MASGAPVATFFVVLGGTAPETGVRRSAGEFAGEGA